MCEKKVTESRALDDYKKAAKDKGRDSWYYAYCMHDTENEKDYGNTIEFGRAYFETEHKKVTIIDVPGLPIYGGEMVLGTA